MSALESLLARLRADADRPAMLWDGGALTCGALAGAVERARGELAARGAGPGDTIAICGTYSPAAVSLLLAAMANGSVAMPLTTKGAARERLLAVARPSLVAEVDDGDVVTWSSRGAVERHPLVDTLLAEGDGGLLLFTSASSGEPKAALHAISRFLERFRTPRTGYRTLALLSFDHIGGVNTLLAALAYGGTLVCTGDRSVTGICRAIERHRVELLPASPTFLRMVLIAEAYRTSDLGSLKLVTYGTEPMPAVTLEALRATLPHVRFKQTYGLTETGILPTRSEGDDSLWMTVGGDGVETQIVDGVLRVRASTAMLGYLNAPSPFDADGWLDTNDVVERRDGYFRIGGRRSEAINVGGEKVFPAEVENLLLALDNVADATVTSMKNALVGEIVVATVHPVRPEEPAAMERRLIAECARELEPYKVPAAIRIATEESVGHRFKKIRRAVALDV